MNFVQSELAVVGNLDNKGFNRTPESSAAAKPGGLCGGAG